MAGDETKADEHPFAAYLRALGRGPNMFRDLEESEAQAAMAMVLADEVEPLQLGAFLMLLRRKGETAAELAGFVRAAKATLPRPEPLVVPDLDWPSYADRHRQQPWFVLSALLLAANGVKVLMHGVQGEEEGSATTRAVLSVLGIRPVTGIEAAARELERSGFAYLALEELSPKLEMLFQLRRLLGVRTAANTFARALNPMNASAQLVGVFHASYRGLHQEIARRLGQPRCAVLKGIGGEFQRSPFKESLVAAVRDGRVAEEEWPPSVKPTSPPYRWRDEDLDPGHVSDLWKGDLEADMPREAVIATAAVALRTVGRAGSPAAAEGQARAMWDARPALLQTA